MNEPNDSPASHPASADARDGAESRARGARNPASSPDDAPLPPGTELLGYGGLLPFAAFTAALWMLPAGGMRDLALRGLIGYGATILSFLGAVHWGFVLRRPGPDAFARLAAGVVPSLVAAAALLMAPEAAIGTLMIGVAGVWLWEHRVLGPGVLPKAYLDLRRTLTVGVLLILLVALLGPVQRVAGST
jgi:hypothetical protein